MDRRIPLETFVDTPLILIGAGGRIRHCNRAASKLLGISPPEERRCWEVLKLESEEGKPFCAASCPVRRELLQGECSTRRDVGVRCRDCRLELLSFAVPGRRAADRRDVLHLLLPDLPGSPQAWNEAAVPRSRMRSLSPRERQILERMSAGRSTGAIADELCISRTTVRNHVQHILGKLGVHNRLQAILAMLASEPDSVVE